MPARWSSARRTRSLVPGPQNHSEMRSSARSGSGGTPEWGGAPLLHLFDFAGTPALVEERFLGTVEAQDSEPALARKSLDPVRLLGFGRLRRAEVHVGRAVGVRHGSGRRKGLASGARVALGRLRHRARLAHHGFPSSGWVVRTLGVR